MHQKRRGEAPGWRAPVARRLDQLLALPMLVLTAVFIVVLVLPVINPHLSPGTRTALDAVDLGIWAAFLAEYLARLFVAPNRFDFVRRNLFDLLLVVVPVLRPLRLLRSIRVIRAVRLTRLAAGAGRLATEHRMRFASRAALLAAGMGVILVLVAAVMVLDVERADTKANIRTLGDAVWWACSTVTTVGYGDHYPVTAAGRAIAIVLMITGVGIFGVLTASAAAWFVTADKKDAEAGQSAAIADLTAEVTALRAQVAALSGGAGRLPPGTDAAASGHFGSGAAVRGHEGRPSGAVP